MAAGSVLASVAVLLGGWAAGGAPQTADIDAAAMSMPAFSIAPALAAGDAASTLARPLFSPGRRPAAAPDAPAASREEAPVSRLIAVAIGPDRSVAVLQLTTGKTSVLVQGEKIDGWELASVAPDHVLLRSNEREVALALPAHSPGRAAGSNSGRQ